MISLFLTLLFYCLAGLLVFWRCPDRVRLFAWGSLPIVWVSLLSLIGLTETLLFLPSKIILIFFLSGLLVYVVLKHQTDLRRFSCTKPSQMFILFSLVFGIAFIFSLMVHVKTPWESWDSMFTWVLRARFLTDGGAIWSQGFSTDLALLHPDYPPMFSWALMPLWKLDGSDSSTAIASLFYSFLIGSGLITAGWWSLLPQRNSFLGYFTFAILLGSPFAIYLFSVKSLDFVLSYAILASMAWFQFAQKEQHRVGWIICGFTVGWAALVKNEGQLWVVSFFGALILISALKSFSNPSQEKQEANRFRVPSLMPMLQGVLVPILFLVGFKILLAPPNDLVDPQRAFEISQVIQPEIFLNPYSLLVRLDQVEQLDWHLLIWKHLWNVSLNWKSWGLLLWAIPVLFLTVVIKKRKSFPIMLLAILIQATGYYFVYLLTPYNPFWHVSTSMDRLLMHIAPTAVCLLGFAMCDSKNEKNLSERNHSPFVFLLVLPIFAVLFCFSQFQLKAFPWNFQNESFSQEQPFVELDFPRVTHATFVTNKFKPATLYRMQFVAVPTILVVDRREEILLGNFSSEEELKAYCKTNGWTLKSNHAGLGWAKSNIQNGPLPHMDRLREQLQH